MSEVQSNKKPFYLRWWFITLVILWGIGYFFGDKNNNSSNIDGKNKKRTEFISEQNQGWYRGVIPAYTMNVGNIEMQKSLLYAKIKNGYTIIMHSQMGSTFVGGGSYSYSQSSNNRSGELSTIAKDNKNNISGYTFVYSLADNGKIILVLKGEHGQPNVTMEKCIGEVDENVFLSDFNRSILN